MSADRLMSIDSENWLIDRLAACIRFLGCDPDDAGEYDEQLQYAHGHSGEGWYLGCASYPDEGAEFIAPLEYGALVVAQAIVALERAALAEDLKRPVFLWDGSLVSKERADELAADVSFVAQLMALGNADVLAEDLASHGSTPVLIFAAEVEEVRKAGVLFRRKVRLIADTPQPHCAPAAPSRESPEVAVRVTPYPERGGA